jgi:hypothetical protein
LFSISHSAGAQPDRFSQRALERRDLAVGGPELELGVARCEQLDEVFVAAIVYLDAGHGLRVAAIERFGEPQHRGERAHGLALLRSERAEVRV